MNFVSNIIWNSVEGFVEAGTRTVGGYAGDALIKAGDLIENSGRGVGGRIERAATGYSTKISGQSYQPSGKALPSTARKPVAKRSNSLPANTKVAGPTSKTPLGANKYPGGTAQKQITNGVSGTKSTVGNAQKKAGSIAGSTPKAIGGTVGGAQKTLPKPYAPSSTGNSYSPAFPTEKKTAVKPGQPPKPFKAPGTGGAEAEKKPYPGTNTYPGQEKKTAVKAQKYKPLPRMQGTAEKGKVQHIAV